MLLDLPAETAGPRFGAHWPLCAAAGIAFAALAWYAGEAVPAPSVNGWVPGTPAAGNLSAVGTALFTRFVLPFEIASLVLLAAIVGAVVLARRKKDA
jgi:NADH-quinone oxidoreductase subunit J